MAKNNKVEISLEEKLKQALVPVDEQPYTIPSNWVWTRLGEVISIFRGLSYTKNDEVENGYLVLRGNNLTDSGLSFLENIYVDEKIAVKGVKVKKDDIILVASTGSSKVIGRACVAKKDYEKTTIGAFLLLCRPKENIIKSWVHYIFKTLRYRLYISEQAKGTNIKNIKNEYLENFYFPLPPLNEQKRIVEKLDFLFEKTKRAKEIIEEVKIDIENRKISILDRAFKGTLTSKWRNENKTSDVKELLKSINDEKIKKWEEDCLQAEKDGNKKPKKPIIKEVKDMIVPVDEQPYKLPDSWVWVKLNNLCDVKGGKRIPKGEEFSNEKTKNVYLRVTDFDNYSINQSKLKYISDDLAEKLKNYKISTEDLYLSIAGTIGKVGIIPYELDKSFLTENAVKLTNLSNTTDNKFLLNCLKTNFIQNLISNSITSSGQPKLAIFRIENFFIPLPPLEEQQEIVRVLDEVLENENKVKELLELEERIDILEKSILHKAFKGELGTQNNSDEHALELLKEIL